MMNYKMVVNSKGLFEVIETPTKHIMRTFESSVDAKNFMRKLNLGNGFDGWTPEFFLKKIDIPNELSDNAV